MAQGKIYLVSVGIGDVENITLRALRILQSADLVFALDWVRERFSEYLQGKTVYPAGHGFFMDAPLNKSEPGEEDCYRQLIREAVANGKTVAILDFGDPALYGPQAGYMTEFADLGLEVVPGVSSFNAANAALGVQLNGPQDFPVVLTNAALTREGLAARLNTLASAQATMVFFTMRMDLAALVELLLTHYRPDTPVAMVCHAGFTADQQVIHGRLGGIVEQIAEIELPWAHLFYVGDFLNHCPGFDA